MQGRRWVGGFARRREVLDSGLPTAHLEDRTTASGRGALRRRVRSSFDSERFAYHDGAGRVRRLLRCASEHSGGRVLKPCTLVKIAIRATVYHSALLPYKIESRAAANWVLSAKEVLEGDEGGESRRVNSGDAFCDDSEVANRDTRVSTVRACENDHTHLHRCGKVYVAYAGSRR